MTDKAQTTDSVTKDVSVDASTAGPELDSLTPSQLRRLASKQGVKRAKLLAKFRHDELTDDEEVALLQATLDLAQVKIAQGAPREAYPLFDDGLVLATAFFLHKGTEPPFIAQLKRLPPLYFPRLVLRLTAKQCKALYGLMDDNERPPYLDELVADQLDHWFLERISQ